MGKQAGQQAGEVNRNETFVICEYCHMFPLCRPLRIDKVEMNLVDNLLDRRVPLQRGDYLFRCGDPFDTIFALCSGSIKISLSAQSSDNRVVGFRFSGELAGVAAIHGGEHNCDAQVLEPTSVCRMPFAAVLDLGIHVPTVQREIIRLMSMQMKHNQQMLFALTGKRSAEEKLASFILSLSKRFQERGFSGTVFRLSMSRDDIGCYLGLVKETVGRLLSRFQKLGLIAVKGRHMELIDNDGLHAMAGDILTVAD